MLQAPNPGGSGVSGLRRYASIPDDAPRAQDRSEGKRSGLALLGVEWYDLGMTNKYDTRPIISAPEGSNYDDLPGHVYLLKVCIYCDQAQEEGTYAEYTEHFYTHEWEGEQDHRPESQADWEFLRDTCLGIVEDTFGLI